MMILLRVNTEIGILVRSLIYGYPARVGAALSLQAGIVRLMLCVYITSAGIAKECNVFSLGFPCGMSCISFESPLPE